MLLAVNDLWAGYGSAPVLQGVSMTAGAGEIVGVLGPNGVGKSTLMRTLCGALKTRRGRVEFDGNGVERLSAYERARAGVGYVPQGREIFPNLTVRENLLVGLIAQRGKRDQLDLILDEFDSLRPKLDARGGSLSGGQQQLLALARALIVKPKLLLLDEPSEGIQPSILGDIASRLLKFKREHGLSILLVEQNLDFAGPILDRAYVMERGRIKREVAKSELADSEALHREFLGVN